jgi:sugar lactone lactonase YvrE
MKDSTQTLISNLGYGESPRWHDGKLWFCNWTVQQILAIDTTGKIEVTIDLPFTAIPFCIDWLPNGQLIIVSASEQPLLRMEPDGSLVPHADLSSLHVKTWNEIAIDNRGNIFINGDDIIALVAANGSVKKVANNISFPNGMVVTSDNSTLVIAESHGKRLTAFGINNDGDLTDRRTWADLRDGVPDGICLDGEGAIWYGDVPNKRCVRVREGGEILQVVSLDKGCFACALGGTNKKTLFMMVAEWRGFEKMFDGKRTGEVQALNVSVIGVK